MDDDAEFSVLDNYGPFMEELGLIENDGDGGGGGGEFNFSNKDELWGAWNKVVEEEDVEGMKRLGKHIQLTGDPVRSNADFGSPVGIKTKLNSLLGHGMHSALYPLISFDAPSVQEVLVPFIREKMKKKTIILSGPTCVMKTSLCKAIFRTMLHCKNTRQAQKMW